MRFSFGFLGVLFLGFFFFLGVGFNFNVFSVFFSIMKFFRKLGEEEKKNMVIIEVKF